MITKDTPLVEIEKLTPACSCDSCKNGCKYGSGILAGDDKKKIANFLRISEEALEEKYLLREKMFNKTVFKPKHDKPYGKCIFFEDGCTIHAAKPLECRISMGCKEYGEQLSQWFRINHVVNPTDPESIRQWATFLKFNKPIPGAGLKDLLDDESLRKVMSYEILR